MIATLQRTEPVVEERVLLHNVSWDTYVRLCDEVGERHIRFTYDDGDLEIMTTSLGHENAGEWIAALIRVLTLELNMSLRSGGSTTMRSPLKKKAIEPDKCFWIANEKVMRGKKQWTAKDPPPDLAVEVDITSSSLNRFGIYAALEIPEIWHFDGETFKVLILRNGKYARATKSRLFPTLPLGPFVRFIEEVEVEDETELWKSFRQWLHDAKVIS